MRDKEEGVNLKEIVTKRLNSKKVCKYILNQADECPLSNWMLFCVIIALLYCSSRPHYIMLLERLKNSLWVGSSGFDTSVCLNFLVIWQFEKSSVKLSICLLTVTCSLCLCLWFSVLLWSSRYLSVTGCLFFPHCLFLTVPASIWAEESGSNFCSLLKAFSNYSVPNCSRSSFSCSPLQFCRVKSCFNTFQRKWWYLHYTTHSDSQRRHQLSCNGGMMVALSQM